MKKIAIITVALMMTASVTFALPAAADQLKVGTSVNTDLISHAPSVASKDAKNAVRLKSERPAAAVLLNTLKIKFS